MAAFLLLPRLSRTARRNGHRRRDRGDGRIRTAIIQPPAEFFANAHAITFYAFDMPMWKGKDLRTQPLDKRRALLRTKAMPKMPAIHFSESFAADGEKMISAIRSQGLEGIVAKRRDSLYEPAGGMAPG